MPRLSSRARPSFYITYTVAFQGPRHDNLYKIWDIVDKSTDSRVVPVNNLDKANHFTMLERLWAQAWHEPERYVVITEHDFLPNLPDWEETAFELLGDYAALAPEYITRRAEDWEIQRAEYWGKSFSGAWFMLLDKEKCPRILDFTGGQEYGVPDPANKLVDQVSIKLMPGEDVFFPGIDYPVGRHLFWSRHYNDDPFVTEGTDTHVHKISSRFINGFSLPAIQMGVDISIKHWLDKHRHVNGSC